MSRRLQLYPRWNKAIRYFHYDANGNCILQTDGSGALTEQYSYDAFGYPYFYDRWGTNLGSSPSGNRFLFTGREWLSDLKLYDYRNRLYQPELGRFLQPDPKHFATGDYNLYRYCHNDPVNKSDPTGMDAVPNADGQTYHFVVRADLVLRNLAGTHVTNPNPRFTEQCATGGQFLTGTNINGRIYDAPKTRTWTQGEAAGPSTTPGTLIARGWENGHYPSKSPNQYKEGEIVNHVGVYAGMGKDGKIKVFDQYAGSNGTLGTREYSRKEGWSVVISRDQRSNSPSESAARALRQSRRRP